jgi:3-deoxy-7-phosphoheptulonate synthase
MCSRFGVAGRARVRDIRELVPPIVLRDEFPLSERASETALDARQSIHDVLHGVDDRLVVIVGPCSIHDYAAAIDYARRLAVLERELAEQLIIVMRVYFEKPRTTVGWKGLINDPRLDDSFPMNEDDARISGSGLRWRRCSAW